MRIEKVKTYESKLPEGDFHPYRTQAWTPNLVEYNACDLDVISGEVPSDLEGVYLRNTENPLFDAISGRYHPFDGDGMIHAAHFQSGKVDYRNRFVRTAGFVAEQAAARPLFAGILESPDLTDPSVHDGWGARTKMKDASSTHVLVHAGNALTTFYQCGDAYRLDPRTLETLGIATNLEHPSFPKGATVSAHPKVDPRTGELLFFNYSIEAPYCNIGICDREGKLLRAIPAPLPGPRLPHDMAFTDRFAIVNDFPLFWDPSKLAQKLFRAKYFPELGSRFGLVPRDGRGDVRWFSAEPTYVLHFSNAYDDGDSVVLEGYRQWDPFPERGPNDSAITMFMKSLDMHSMKTRLHRWRFDLKTGKTHEESLDDRVSEFPTMNQTMAGRKARYVYAVVGEPGLFLFSGLTKTDLQTGNRATYAFPRGLFASEAPFCPRTNAKSEDDGYLVTFVSDVRENASECQIFDAQSVERGPVARLRLPERISSGTHATWAGKDELSG